MNRKCPNFQCLNAIPGPPSRRVVRKGYFYRRSDRRYIARFKCLACGKQFSAATFSPDYLQKRRDINPKIYELICSGVSQRRLARVLQVNPKTIVRKFRILADRARSEHSRYLEKFKSDPLLSIQFDDLETHEHTKMKPLSVALAVNVKTREIIGFRVSKMPAKGLLARRSIRKYGKRPDERMKGWNSLLRNLRPYLSPAAIIESDENPHYPAPLKKHCPLATHIRHPGARGSSTGQGELKKIGFDPLFALNHTCAMLRANLNRLFRKTWCTTKTIQGLRDHLSIYQVYHNQNLPHLHAH